MSELVELIAEAIWNAPLPPEKPGEPYWRAHMNEARAAIEAIEAAGYRIVEDEKLLSTKDMYVEFFDADGTSTLITTLDKIVVDIVLPEKPK